VSECSPECAYSVTPYQGYIYAVQDYTDICSQYQPPP
jgi:hypothetical protein